MLPEQSGQFIDWLAAGDEPPRAVKVGDEKIVPVRRGQERQAKTHREDPSAPGNRLPVDNISKVTGVDFTGVSHECCQLFRVALGNELRGVGVRELRSTARTMVGQNPKAMAAELPDAFEAFEVLRKANRLPDLEMVDRPEAPPAPGFPVTGAAEGARAGSPSAPLFYLIANGARAGDLVRAHLRSLVRTGDIRLEMDSDAPMGSNRAQYHRAKIEEAAVAVFFLNSLNLASDDFLALAEHALREKKVIIPIRAGHAIVDGTPFKGLVSLPRKEGRLLDGDEEGTAVAVEIRRMLPGIVQHLAATHPAIASSADAWMDRLPLRWNELGPSEFCQALSDAYPDVAACLQVCRSAGVLTSRVETTGGVLNVWRRVLDSAASQGKLRALVANVRGDRNVSAFFRP